MLKRCGRRFWGDYRSLLPPVCQRRLNRIVGQARRLGKKKRQKLMTATFSIVRRVFEARTFRSRIYRICEGVETMLRNGDKFEFYSVTLCFPAIMLTVIAIALYINERNKKL
jgi:hypothetical protein